jgi:hypothetical protein
MVSSEVQRTLVKSPPELWAELSDPAALARHLGELGEIRITRVEPEQKVEWEGNDTSGTVLINPSGWGTKVTLTVTREIPEAESPATPGALAQPDTAALAEPEAMAAEREPIVEPEPSPYAEDRPEAEQVIATDPELEDDFMPEPEPQHEASVTSELEPRRGFFARLFRRRGAIPSPSFETPDDDCEQSNETLDAFAAVTRALAPETFAAAHPFATAHLTAPPTPDPIAEPAPIEERAPIEKPAQGWAEQRAWAGRATSDEPMAPAAAEPHAQPQERAEDANDISAEIRAAEEVAAEQVTAVLTSVLDRLGAAHHRPFSRA